MAIIMTPCLQVVTRRGNPFDAEDLARVNAFAARRVIILHPHEDEVGLLGQGVHARDESDESGEFFFISTRAIRLTACFIDSFAH